MLTQPLPTLQAWTDCLAAADLPVLASTTTALALLAETEAARGTVDAHQIGEAIQTDPFMTVRLLAHLGQHRRPQQTGEAETAVAGVMMMGIGPFFQAFGRLESVEDRLADQPQALAGMHRVLARSHRAARFALDFAVHRQDSDAMAVYEAALLHDLAEMLLWIHAPVLAADIQARQDAAPGSRSAEVQLSVLNIRLDDLQQALMTVWRLPEVLVQLNDRSQHHALIAPQRRMVQLAVRMARHTSTSWLDAAVPDDVREIAELLTLSVSATQRLLHKIDT